MRKPVNEKTGDRPRFSSRGQRAGADSEKRGLSPVSPTTRTLSKLTMAQSFDAVVIGGGPGGYVAAIRAAQLGLKTACIDDWKTSDGKPALGGTCTNIGCIPSKALLQSSENFEQAGHGFAEHGVRVKGLELDLAQMLKRKDQVVKASNDGVVYLFKRNKIAFFHGRGSFVKAGADGCEVAVAGAQNETLTAKNVIIATGSVPRTLSGAAFDEKLVLSNDGALAIPEVPKRLGVIGAGVIGLEMGSVWRDRKSTRLNSSHQIISYAVFCLTKKNDAE